MYAKTLRAQIFWNYDEDPKSISVPLTETVRVVGKFKNLLLWNNLIDLMLQVIRLRKVR